MEIPATKPETQRSEVGLPNFVAIEGPIGVGKTSLAKKLAASFNYGTLLERAEDNPFLARYYKNRRATALSTQLFFLLQRAQQIQDLRQSDMFEPLHIADFLLEKDPLFARVTLDEDELAIYQAVYQQLAVDCPQPDLVIYLQAPAEVLLQRIRQRGIDYERHIDIAYLNSLNQAYMEFFHHYDNSPLLIVNATEIDPIRNEPDYQNLVNFILTIRSGRHFYNPHPHASQ